MTEITHTQLRQATRILEILENEGIEPCRVEILSSPKMPCVALTFDLEGS